MITVLSALTRLESLHLQFQSPRSRPDQASQHPPSPTRTALPVLTKLKFKGASEYLEFLLDRVDVPQLSTLDINFFYQILFDTDENVLDPPHHVFDTPQLLQFICRTPKLKVLENAHVIFENGAARVTLSSQTSGHREFTLEFSCEGSDWQL